MWSDLHGSVHSGPQGCGTPVLCSLSHGLAHLTVAERAGPCSPSSGFGRLVNSLTPGLLRRIGKEITLPTFSSKESGKGRLLFKGPQGGAREMAQ